ncbi:MAG: formylglycine-generating enzyme family protein [Desulfobulbales bacterium]|nr:formylglycine-generating enzyme family protein [Desulfobulbales bacterium]
MKFLTKPSRIQVCLLAWLAATALNQPCLAADQTDDNPQYSENGLTLWREPLIELEFVWLEGGCFLMGQSDQEKQILIREAGALKYRDFYADELPRHQVCVDGFWLARHEITRLQWKQLMATEPFPADLPDDHPATNISWLMAMDFIVVLNGVANENFRLPTEAEMEYAIRAGTGAPFNTGQTISTEQANYNGVHTFDNGQKGAYLEKTAPVKSYPANRFGLFDTHGNVWEWCSDWYVKDYYKNSPADNPEGPATGKEKVMRGGSWFTAPRSVRSANRRGLEPDIALEDSGFRLVAKPLPPRQAAARPSSIDKKAVFDPDF